MTKTMNSQCDAPGHEDCSGWIICDHAGVKLEFNAEAQEEAHEWWCPRCDMAADQPRPAWCPERVN